MPKSRPILSITVAVAFVTATAGALAPPASGQPTAPTEYLVLYKGAQADAAARSAITRAGGTITKENNKIGYAYVRTPMPASPARCQPPVPSPALPRSGSSALHLGGYGPSRRTSRG